MSREPTASQRACIAELLLRFPCPRDVHPDDYNGRAELLARDCASLQSGLLRKACDRAAINARGLPFAAEIHSAAAAILKERTAAEAQRSNRSEEPQATLDQALREENLRLCSLPRRRRETRWINENGQPRLIVVTGDRVDGRCNGDGTVSLRRWDHDRRDWFFETLTPAHH